MVWVITDSYINKKHLEVEDKILQRFSYNPVPMTMEELIEFTGIGERSVRRVLQSIAGYSGYKVEKRTSSKQIVRYQIIYTPENDQWANFLAGATNS